MRIAPGGIIKQYHRSTRNARPYMRSTNTVLHTCRKIDSGSTSISASVPAPGSKKARKIADTDLDVGVGERAVAETDLDGFLRSGKARNQSQDQSAFVGQDLAQRRRILFDFGV